MVTLDFDFFDTQLDYDYAYIYDGNTTNSSIIAKLHGSFRIPPQGLTSTQQYMLVRFTSDANVGSIGFSAKFTATSSGWWLPVA